MKDFLDKKTIDGKTWYAYGSLRSRYWAEKHAKVIKEAGGKIRIVGYKEGDWQVFTDKRNLATL